MPDINHPNEKDASGETADETHQETRDYEEAFHLHGPRWRGFPKQRMSNECIEDDTERKRLDA